MKNKRNKKIVCLGGGSVVPKVILAELKKYPVEITSITSMVESGGSTGQLRKDLDILPPGDISRHLVALSDGPQWKKDLFLFRFGREKFPGGHQGYRFGTVFIAGLEYVLKDFEKALKIASEFLEIKKHQALPSTLTKTNLWANLEDGKAIKGEDEVDVPKLHSGKLKIKIVYLKPEAKAYQPTIKAIKKANKIILGPGDLYSSIIPCLLPKGIKEALRKSKAKKIFICNLMNKYGETNDFTVLNFTNEIERYLGQELDFVIYNNQIPSLVRFKNYKKEHPELLSMVELNKNLSLSKFIGKDLLLEKGPIEHDPKKLVKILMSL